MTTTSHSEVEGECLRRCRTTDHYANCVVYEGGTCDGCAPARPRPGQVVCDGCFGRMRSLLRDLPDLRGRMRSQADPARAAVFDRVRVTTSSSTAQAPLDDDLADALRVVEEVLDMWLAYGHDLKAIAGDERTARWFLEQLLTEHTPVAGVRDGWSVLDAMRRWGVERRDRPVAGFSSAPRQLRPSAVYDEQSAVGVPEWYDRPLDLQKAAERAGVSQRQLRNWVSDGVLAPMATLRQPNGTVMKWFFSSAVDGAAEVMKERRNQGRSTPDDGTAVHTNRSEHA